jgi:hypothetical protein
MTAVSSVRQILHQVRSYGVERIEALFPVESDGLETLMNRTQRRILSVALLLFGGVCLFLSLLWATDRSRWNDREALILFFVSAAAITGGLYVRAGGRD